MSKRLLRSPLAAAVLLACLSSAARVQHSVEDEASDQPGFSLAGVPIYGAMPSAKMRLAPGTPEPKREWIVMMHANATDDEVKHVCGDAGRVEGDCLEGHPTEGGVPFAEVSLSDDELEAVLTKHPGRVQFVELDAPVYAIPELPGDDATSPFLDTEGELLGAGGLDMRMPWPNMSSSFMQSFAKIATPWGLKRTGAHKTRGKGRGVHVYVLDTGVRTTHVEFGGRAIPTLEVIGGRMRPCSPRDTTCAFDRQGHGTHCAATVGGESTGVANGATIHAVKVLGDDGVGSQSWTVGALDWIIRNGERPTVCSLSLGGKGQSRAYSVAIDQAVSRGVTVVVAAGNENDNACSYSPAFATKAITVGATTPGDERSGFSNFGSCVNIFAPGSNIVAASHESDSEFSTKSGTSMACPHVSGAAARLLEQNPNMNRDAIMAEFRNKGQKDAIYDVRGAPNLMLIVEEGYELGEGGGGQMNYNGWVGEQMNGNPSKWITAQAFSGSHAIVTMHTMPWTGQTVWRASFESLKGWITEKWNAGYSLTSLRHAGRGKWAAVLSSGTSLSGGGYLSRQTLSTLKPVITNDVWNQHMHIIDISYGQGVWMMTYAHCSEFYGQSWSFNTWNEQQAWIKHAWDKNYRITRIASHGGMFMVVVSQVTTMGGQTYFWASGESLPTKVKEYWDKGYEITSVLDDFEADPSTPYLVVMTHVRGSKLFPNQGSGAAYKNGIVS